MLKKLASLLFEEEEVEEPAPKPSKKKIDEPVREEPAPLPTPTRSFESIAADEPEPNRESIRVTEPVHVEPIRSEPVRREPLLNEIPRPAPNKSPSNPAPYEFRPLISPIFGISEHEQVHRPAFVGTAEVQNDSHLQTVISPYYGAIHKDPKMKQEPHREVRGAPVLNEVVIEKAVEPEPVIENLSLEALITPESEPIAESLKEPEDHEQFSLFGEEK